jgi:DNA-binding NarL/FixJ family response regulator
VGVTGRLDPGIAEGGRPAAPVIVVEGSDGAFERAVAEVAAAGWKVVPGFKGSVERSAREIRSGTVTTADDASAALLAVLGGAGLVVHGYAPHEILDRLLDDLRHAGQVDHRRSGEETASPSLDEDARAILERLAAGQTLGEAAVELGLSRRTADRRLADARAALGVERTVEAVAKARRLGWLG